MRFGLLIILIISCRQADSTSENKLKKSVDNNFKKPTETTVTFKITQDEIDKTNFPTVDSLFYTKYLKSNGDFCNGPILYCRQYYYEGKEAKGGKIFILQKKILNEIHYSLYLLTIDSSSSLKSIVRIASVHHDHEMSSNLTSILDPIQNEITSYEITDWKFPESIDPVDKRLKFCRDSIISKFTADKGVYKLNKRDSLKVCEWRKSE